MFRLESGKGRVIWRSLDAAGPPSKSAKSLLDTHRGKRLCRLCRIIGPISAAKRVCGCSFHHYASLLSKAEAATLQSIALGLPMLATIHSVVSIAAFSPCRLQSYHQERKEGDHHGSIKVMAISVSQRPDTHTNSYTVTMGALMGGSTISRCPFAR